MNSQLQPVWDNNPVNAQATCFFYPRSAMGHWDSLAPTMPVAAPKKIASLGPNNRQCFLGWITGGDGAFLSGSSYAEVKRIPVASSTYPSSGWYVQSNLSTPPGGASLQVGAICIDFPSSTVGTNGQALNYPGMPIETIATGAGIKGCGLTAVVGIFQTNSYSNGIAMKPPPTSGGDWGIQISPSKVAVWQCEN